MGNDWTDDENDAIVLDYFAMLAEDVARRPYNKAQHNRLLQTAIDRTHGSIEYKHRNISAVQKGLGEDWIPGYKPAFNIQTSLTDAVARWLDRHAEWLASVSRRHRHAREQSCGPTLSNAPPPHELEQMTAIARKYDIAERDGRTSAGRSECWQKFEVGSARACVFLIRSHKWYMLAGHEKGSAAP